MFEYLKPQVVVLSIVVQTWDAIPGFFGQVGLAMLTLM
jgi:hypothetical protein